MTPEDRPSTGADRPAATTDADTEVADVAVVGSGMAGLVAALRATDFGAEPVVLEKGPRPGGSTYISSGQLYTYRSMEALASDVPTGNRGLQELLVERFEPALDWLEATGVTLEEPYYSLPFGDGVQIDPEAFTEGTVDRIEDGGGEVRLETPMESLLTATGNEVRGVVARRPDDGVVEIEAERVVLATGGFQGNEELVARHITSDTENLWLRSNPWSTGDGLLAATDAGAKTTQAMDSFYGHNVAADPAVFSTREFVEVSQYYGPYGIALNRDGERFTDESASTFEARLAQETARRVDGKAYYVIDDDVYGSDHDIGVPVGPMVDGAEEHGGWVGTAGSVDELGATLAERDVNGAAAVETVVEYNEHVQRGRGDELTPPRADIQEPLDSPPFYAVEVQPGITFTTGGLDVDDDCRVLRRSRSSSTLHQYPEDVGDVLVTPIDGLYAAGADVGGVHGRRYVGGLAVALVTGYVAGEHAGRHVGEGR